ncbi:unnamed protein product [Mytilus coruscus]|uniref:HAT C-terminal dimerisation domain-containing protein n=1 Tax=Mytilus coruscus TaxID=42192 RepID=A0A6J8AI30_MYTCO|nr:unnamed protein product [Mytilus coruscus]
MMVRLLKFKYKCVENQLGFIPDMYRLFIKYNLLQYIVNLIELGSFPSKIVWNNVVSQNIHKTEQLKWLERISNDSDFNFFKLIHPVIKLHKAWIIAKRYPDLRVASKYIIDLCAVVRIEVEQLLCEKCGKLFSNVLEHILYSCDFVLDYRNEMWRDIININPIWFSVYMDSLSSLEFTATLLSCDTKYELDGDEFSIVFSKLCVQNVYNTYEKSENESGDESDSESEIDDFNVELPDDNFPTLGHCFAHTLQLVVKDGLKDTSNSLKTVISKAANIVKFVRKSVNASDILENEKRLQSDNATRWNSQIIMIRSILAVPEEKLAKTGASVQLSPYERKLLKELCSILKPFEDATIMVQKDKSVSASLVVPIYMGLTHQINELSVTYNNKMVQTLKLSLEKRLGDSMSDDNFLLAAMLDPTIKLRWCNSSDSMEMENKLLLNAKKYISSIHVDSESCDTDDSSPQKKSRTDSPASGILSFMTPKKKRIRHLSGDPAKLEVNQYFMEPCIENNPLGFWESNEHNYPILASMAKRFLAILASSAPVERLFSIAGKIFCPDRCRLSDNTFHKLIMIKCNSDF